MLVCVCWTVDAAQGAGPPRVAYLTSDEACTTNVGFRALVEGLQALGYRDKDTVALECRSAEGRYERLDTLAEAMVRLEPAVLVAAAAPASLAAQRATTRIPIVSVYTADPIGLGLVKSFARPEANVTGISALASDYSAKSLQLLREIAPRTKRVGVLGNASNPTYVVYRRELEAAARAIGLTIDFASADAPEQIESTLSALRSRGADSVLVMHQPFTFTHRARILRTISRLRLPAMYGSREAVEAGGLISFAASVADTFRRAAYFADKLLRGAKPGDLPFEQPTKFELVFNVRTAGTLGLMVPHSLRIRADRVVE